METLQKELQALKVTLVVIRTVLHHGKDYGLQKAGVSASVHGLLMSLSSLGASDGFSLHDMQEVRVILESVIAKNRKAIMDLHKHDDVGHRSGTFLPSERVETDEPSAGIDTATVRNHGAGELCWHHDSHHVKP